MILQPRRYIVRRLSTFKETGSRDWIALCERISNPEIRPNIPGLDILKNWTSRYNRKSGLESGFPKTPFTWNTHTITMSNKNLAFSGVPNLLAGFGSFLQTMALNPARHSLSPSSFPSTTGGPNVQAGFGGSLQATSLNPAQHSSSPSSFQLPIRTSNHCFPAMCIAICRSTCATMTKKIYVAIDLEHELVIFQQGQFT